jgi:F-type H+-transporting ATPase subunit b
MMDIHPGLMIWTIISFILLLMILKKIAWGPILKALDEREKGIKDAIKSAADAQAAANRTLAEYKTQMAEARAEAQSIIAKSRQDAERIRDEIISKSKVDAQSITEKATKQIDLERQEAIHQIRAEIATMVVDAASKVIRRALNEEDHKRLILDTLDQGSNSN